MFIEILQSGAGPWGAVKCGDRLEVGKDIAEGTARMLLNAGIAQPSQNRELPETGMVHLGGGWYQVGDRKIKGKAKAQAAIEVR